MRCRRVPCFATGSRSTDLGSREHRGRLSHDSLLAGKRVGDLALRAAGINLLAIERRGRFRTDLIRPAAQTELERGDVLLVDVLDPGVEIAKLCEKYALEAMPLDQDTTYFTDRSQELGMVEVILPPDSSLIGQTVLEAGVRKHYGLTAIGLRHGRDVCGHGLLRERLKAGDTLLLVRVLVRYPAVAGRNR